MIDYYEYYIGIFERKDIILISEFFAVGIGILYSIYFWYNQTLCRELWYILYLANFNKNKFNSILNKRSYETTMSENINNHSSIRITHQNVAPEYSSS